MAMPPMQKAGDVSWEIPTAYKEGMRVPAKIYATAKLIQEMDQGVFNQVTNVACLPGIQKYAYCMPDGHWGYGFPIGGVAAFRTDEGIISPGGIGFDINCGVRLIRTSLTEGDVRPKLKELLNLLFDMVPAGVGVKGSISVSNQQLKEVMVEGARWCIPHGYGWEKDLEHIEDYGTIGWADPSKVSSRAMARGAEQLGTLGSGNHYLEIQKITNVFNQEVATALGIGQEGQICVMVHCGSRGFGHQVGTDYIRVFDSAMRKYGIRVNDRELVCVPFSSPEGQDYFKAMACAANNAFANRQAITHFVRQAFSQVLKRSPEEMGMELVYDVAHNIAKVEKHKIDGVMLDVVVHRKGATRCFGPSREEIPRAYRELGQPVIVGGSMETGSCVLVGTDKAMEETFGSTCHGSGRTMSRAAAKKQVWGEKLQKEMEQKGILVKAASMSGLAEEAGFAYKNLTDVVDTMDTAGISKKVILLKPIGNIKG